MSSNQSHGQSYGQSWSNKNIVRSLSYLTDHTLPPFLAHLSRRLKGELIVYWSIRRPCVGLCVNKHFFKLEYLRNQWANRNEILSGHHWGGGKAALGSWARSDRNSGVHGNG